MINNSTSCIKVSDGYFCQNHLHQINDINSLKYTTENDLFAFKLNYDSIGGIPCGISEQYNGNISETYWRTASDNIIRKYGYEYDDLHRLTNAIYPR